MYLSLALLALILPTPAVTTPISTDAKKATAALFEESETVFHTSPALIAQAYKGNVVAGFEVAPFGYLTAALDKRSVGLRRKIITDSDRCARWHKRLPQSGWPRARFIATMLRGCPEEGEQN
jgi:hypothetical protein